MPRRISTDASENITVNCPATITIGGQTLQTNINNAINLEGIGGESSLYLNETVTLVNSTGSINITSAQDLSLNGTTGNTVLGNLTSSNKIYGQWNRAIQNGASVDSTERIQAGYKGFFEDRYWYGTTTNAIQTALNGTFTPATSGTVSIRVVTELIGCSSTGAQVYGACVSTTFKRVSGVLTVIGTSSEKDVHETTGTMGAFHGIDGTTQIALAVTGVAATNIRWEGFCRVYYCAAF